MFHATMQAVAPRLAVLVLVGTIKLRPIIPANLALEPGALKSSRKTYFSKNIHDDQQLTVKKPVEDREMSRTV
jgi:hypothetical protein